MTSESALIGLLDRERRCGLFLIISPTEALIVQMRYIKDFPRKSSIQVTIDPDN